MYAPGFRRRGQRYLRAAVAFLASVDSSFGQWGSVDTNFDAQVGALKGYAYAFERLGNGQILVGGDFALVNESIHPALARLKNDGEVDSTFTPPFQRATVVNFLVQSDGKPVAEGNMLTTAGVYLVSPARFNLDGSVDTNFAISGASFLNLLAIQSDDRLLVQGYPHTSTNYSLQILRLNSNGGYDDSFQWPTNLSGTASVRFALPLRNGGVLAVVLTTSTNGPEPEALVRLGTDGSYDMSFNPPDYYSAGVRVAALAELYDGRVVAAFESAYGTSSSNAPTILTLQPDGSVDGTFQPPIAPASNVRQIAVRSDHRILIAGTLYDTNGTPVPQVMLLETNGTRVTNFVAALPTNSYLNRMVLEADGGILFSSSDATLGRLTPLGVRDTNFAPRFERSPAVSRIALQSDGKILFSGNFEQVASSNRFVIARLNPGGTVDDSFDIGYIPPGGELTATAIQPDGKILAAGRIRWPFRGIARLLTNGTPDWAFTNEHTFVVGVVGDSRQFAVK